jgi:hypothetical protein
MEMREHDDKSRAPTKADKPRLERPASERDTEHLELPQRVCVRAPGLRSELTTVEAAIRFIDKRVAPELAKLPRWTFARALLLEAQKTRKARDLRAAIGQFTQALTNEHWLDVDRTGEK